MELSAIAFVSYANKLREHIACVQDAGLAIGVPMPQLAMHDASKWTPEEFAPYAKHFFTHGPDDPYSDEMALAWLTHLHRNPHHWQHWTFDGKYSSNSLAPRVENGVVRMPNNFALEMVADWMGASMSYSGSWDMTAWLVKNMPKIRLHPETAAYVRETLDILGYADIVNAYHFAGELQGAED